MGPYRFFIGLTTCLVMISVVSGCAVGVGAAPGAPTPTVTPHTSSCADPVATIRSFYDDNDAGQPDASLSLLTDDITYSFWAEGANGHHMMENHLAGKDQVRAVLGDNGLRRTSSLPGGPVFHEGQFSISGDMLTFMLQTDRLHPNGRPYNGYRIEAVFRGCQIKSLAVVEMITWL